MIGGAALNCCDFGSVPPEAVLPLAVLVVAADLALVWFSGWLILKGLNRIFG